MNVHLAKKGHKVRFANRGGWNGEWERAAAILNDKEVYTISKVEIHQSSTDVFLEGFGDRDFNSVFFELVGVADYWAVEDLTSPRFADVVKGIIEPVLVWHELEQFFITMDDEDDSEARIVVVDAKFDHALYTFWFNSESGTWHHEILEDHAVKRYESISKGLRPELPEGLDEFKNAK